MIHINKFIDKIKAAESRHSTNFIMHMSEAQNLHSDITKLLMALHELSHNQGKSSDEITTIEIKGNDF